MYVLLLNVYLPIALGDDFHANNLVY